MLALVAAVLILLYSLGINPDAVNLLYLGLAFWAAHFAFAVAIPWGRRG